MSDQWYYGQNGVQKGPVSQDVMRQLIASRQLRPDDLVWREGMANWEPLASVRELAAPSHTSAPYVPPAAPVQPAAPVPPGAVHPTGMPAPYQPLDPVAAGLQSKATTAMVLGICSIVLGGCICGPVGLALGITAIVLGKGAELAPNTGHARAGFICGIVGVCLSALGTVGNIIMLVD